MHKMKVIFFSGLYAADCIFLLFAFGHWIISLANVGGWKALNGCPPNKIPHSDHIEMSGKQVSVVLRYGVNADGAFCCE